MNRLHLVRNLFIGHFFSLKDIERTENDTWESLGNSFTSSLVINKHPKERWITSQNSDQKKKKKRRRHSNPTFLPAIRILRRDIRRKYGEMMSNVLNSCDRDLCLRFLKAFAIPTFISYYQVFPSELLTYLHCSRKIEGVEEVVEIFCRKCFSAPDIVFHASDNKVCQRLNTPGSRVVANLSVKGTMLYAFVSDRNHAVEDQSEDSFIDQLAQKMIFLQKLNPPLDISLKGSYTLLLDEQHRIIALVINATWS